MSKIKIDRNDANRILLTELLPYEVPMLFSNDGFYSIISSKKHEPFFKKIKERKSSYGIPFNYEIAKSTDNEMRCLSVIHPMNQFDFIEFYKKYDSIIIHLCSKSPFSLRKVSRIAKFCYSPDLVFEEDEHQNQEVEVEPEVLDHETKVFKSYFTYNPIDLIYKFYERNEYQRLEQRFNFILEFDISKCFYHIYTHSITWAVKDKESAKKHFDKETFENSFDQLMQKANYNETNGILVGPEVSRIFAEIILQQIDVNVIKKLEEKNLKVGIDYEVRRYVDDFFAFANEEKTLDLILRTYKKELEFYKLYINPGKTEKRSTPFITNISVGKHEIRKLVLNLFNNLIEVEGGNAEKAESTKKIRSMGRPYSQSQNFIKDFQCVVRQNDLTYDIVNKDVVRLFKGELVKILKDPKIDTNQNEFENFLLMYLDIAFYCYSLNVNASITFKIAQIIVIIVKCLEGKKQDLKHTIFSKISREAEFVMTAYHRKTKINETNIETLNLLLALKKLGTGYFFTEKKIREFFNLLRTKEDTNADELSKFLKLNYFQIITLLYYFDTKPDYIRVKKTLEKAVVKKFELTEDPFTKSEFTCLFFDFICCPFVDLKSKKKVMRHSKYSQDNVENEIRQIEEQKMWFMNWDPNIDLERVLKKKEWSSSY
jgi:hypothetical protein